MRRYLLLAVILGLLLSHEIWPDRFKLDWQTIVLIGVLVTILCSRELSAFLPFVKRFKWGEAEIEMRESTQQLHQNIEKAEVQAGTSLLFHAKSPQLRKNLTDSDEDTLDNILELAGRDKESAVVRLAIEIEKTLAAIFQSIEPAAPTPKSIRGLVEDLGRRNVLSRATCDAIIEFRDVRNRVIHPAQGALVPESLLWSAVDSGLRLLRLLQSVSGRH